jgi:hypothetical protein
MMIFFERLSTNTVDKFMLIGIYMKLFMCRNNIFCYSNKIG